MKIILENYYIIVIFKIIILKRFFIFLYTFITK